jgi:hypothetical protein
MKRLLAAAVMAMCVSTSLNGEEPLVPTLVMQDQFAKAHDVSKLRGEVVVLVFADRGGAEASRDLGAKLHVHFHPTAKGKPATTAAQAPVRAIPGVPSGVKVPDAKMIPIAVIGDVPAAMHPMIRFRFRQVAADAPIWLDFTDAMRKQFTVEKDVPNVAVLDVDGQVRYTTSGKLTTQQFDELAQAIETLRREALTR